MADTITFVEMGGHGEHSVVLQRVIRVEGLPETRGGHVVEKDGKPVFSHTLMVFEDGSSIVVPHTKAEVLGMFVKAVRGRNLADPGNPV